MRFRYFTVVRFNRAFDVYGPTGGPEIDPSYHVLCNLLSTNNGVGGFMLILVRELICHSA